MRDVRMLFFFLMQSYTSTEYTYTYVAVSNLVTFKIQYLLKLASIMAVFGVTPCLFKCAGKEHSAYILDPTSIS